MKFGRSKMERFSVIILLLAIGSQLDQRASMKIPLLSLLWMVSCTQLRQMGHSMKLK